MNTAIFVFTSVAAVLIPSLGVLLSVLPYWDQHAVVDKRTCGCNCWDGKFKGPFVPSTGLSVYFNVEPATVLIFLWAYCSVAAFHWLLAHLCELGWSGRMRKSVMPLICVNLYSHIYGAWAVFNYLNEPSHHHRLPSQLFFGSTETVISWVLVRLADRKSEIRARTASGGLLGAHPYLSVHCILWLASLSLVHICLSVGTDGLVFGWNLPRNQGHGHVWGMLGIRDTVLLLADVATLWFGWRLLRVPQLPGSGSGYLGASLDCGPAWDSVEAAQERHWPSRCAQVRFMLAVAVPLCVAYRTLLATS